MPNNFEPDTIVFFTQHFGMGGTETLILRLTKYYKSLGRRVILLTMNKLEANIIDDFEDVKPEYYLFENKKSEFFDIDKPLTFHKSELPLIITEFLPEFFRCYLMFNKNKYGVDFKHKVYIVHPYSIFYGPRAANLLAKKMIELFLRKQALVFMDNVCVEACITHYQLSKNHNFKVLHLPIFLNEEEGVNSRNENLSLLTICRFEFPFKGYVLGLIRSFEILSKKVPSITLTIVGNGNDKFEVDKLINSLPEEVSSKIKLINGIPYSKIEKLIRVCDIYIGMGTTILDAANQNKICITAVAYQLDNKAVGFFHENYATVGEVSNPSKIYSNFVTLLEKVIYCSDLEFKEMSLSSKKALKEHYDIKKIGKELITIPENRFSFGENILISCLAVLHLSANWFVKNIRDRRRKE
jgi:hypothetical protein